MRRKLLGDDHVDVAESLTGLSGTLSNLGKPDQVRNHAIEINRLYNLSIELQSRAVLDLFKTKDLLLIIKLKDIYEGLGRVMEKCNDVGHALNDIAMSHS